MQEKKEKQKETEKEFSVNSEANKAALPRSYDYCTLVASNKVAPTSLPAD